MINNWMVKLRGMGFLEDAPERDSREGEKHSVFLQRDDHMIDAIGDMVSYNSCRFLQNERMRREDEGIDLKLNI